MSMIVAYCHTAILYTECIVIVSVTKSNTGEWYKMYQFLPYLMGTRTRGLNALQRALELEQ